MVWLVVAGKSDNSTPLNMVELDDGRLNVNAVNRCCEVRSRLNPKKNKNGFPEANKDFVAKKIQSLRGSFRTELKKGSRSQRSGSGADENYVPSLWYYNLLLFTKDQELPTDSVSSIADFGILIEEENTEENEKGGTETGIISSMSQEPIKRETETSPWKARKKKPKDSQAEFLSVCTVTLRATSKELSEFDAAGINMAKKLARMDSAQAIFAESFINTVLLKGLLKKLTEDTDFCENGYTIRSSSSVQSDVSSIPSVEQRQFHSFIPVQQQQPLSNELREFY
ncbi:hypothetical protein EVAR_85725_1 [Eumeta japonica]|uniref:MADF domain-containing protein n=1 Tax=Eumeta variegata TaxID=151549 RepID=A0A4C1Y5X5_EUMVA|nr:hypothetical protein EVAR_85725_1 [Eumeta japonica]